MSVASSFHATTMAVASSSHILSITERKHFKTSFSWSDISSEVILASLDFNEICVLACVVFHFLSMLDTVRVNEGLAQEHLRFSPGANPGRVMLVVLGRVYHRGAVVRVGNVHCDGCGVIHRIRIFFCNGIFDIWSKFFRGFVREDYRGFVFVLGFIAFQGAHRWGVRPGSKGRLSAFCVFFRNGSEEFAVFKRRSIPQIGCDPGSSRRFVEEEFMIFSVVVWE